MELIREELSLNIVAWYILITSSSRVPEICEAGKGLHEVYIRDELCSAPFMFHVYFIYRELQKRGGYGSNVPDSLNKFLFSRFEIVILSDAFFKAALWANLMFV